MIKADIIENVAAKAHLTHQQAKDALNAFMKATSDALKKGDNVKLEMFGTFTVTKRNEKKGIHPKTGEPIVIGAKKVVRFKPSPALGPPLPKGKKKNS